MILPPRSVLLAIAQARVIPEQLQNVLWSSGDETVQALVAATDNISPVLEAQILSGNNSRLLAAWAAAGRRRSDAIEKIAKTWGAHPHIAGALLQQESLHQEVIEYLARNPSPGVAGALLRRAETPKQYRPALACCYLQGHESIRSNVSENVMETLGRDVDVWVVAVSRHSAAHPALLSAVPQEALDHDEMRQALASAIDTHADRARNDPTAQRHLGAAISALLRHPGTRRSQLETLEAQASMIAPELASKIATRKHINIAELKKRGICASRPCAGEDAHTQALLSLINSLRHVDLNSVSILPSAIEHLDHLSKEHMRSVARNLTPGAASALKACQDQGFTPHELARGAEILGVDSLGRLDEVENVVAILAGKGWEPLRYAHKLSPAAREATWRNYRPVHALLHDSNHYTAGIAGVLGTLDEESLETALTLLPTWGGSVTELAQASQALRKPPAPLIRA